MGFKSSVTLFNSFVNNLSAVGSPPPHTTELHSDKTHKDNGAMYLMSSNGWEFVGDIVTEGIVGPIGPQGKKGEQGPKGNASKTIAITGTFESQNDFTASQHPDGEIALIKATNELLLRNRGKNKIFRI